MTAPPQLTAYKWIYVLVVPLALTVAVYAIVDTSKFQGYSSEERLPLSNWKGGTFWLVDVSAFLDAPKTYALYIVRMILSIVINISSILLVLIDTVCLQVRIIKHNYKRMRVSNFDTAKLKRARFQRFVTVAVVNTYGQAFPKAFSCFSSK